MRVNFLAAQYFTFTKASVQRVARTRALTISKDRQFTLRCHAEKGGSIVSRIDMIASQPDISLVHSAAIVALLYALPDDDARSADCSAISHDSLLPNAI